MNPRILLAFRVALPVLAASGPPLAAQQDPLTYETTRWIYSHGDFHDANLDGRTDLALVDKTDATVTIGLQRLDGGFDWTAPEPTGIAAPTGLAAGFFNNVPAHQLAVTAPHANRITLFTARDAATPLGIRHAYPSLPVMHSIAPFHVDGDGASDLLAVGELNLDLLPDPYHTSVTATLDTTPDTLWEDVHPSKTHRVWAFRQKAFTPPLLAATRGNEFFVSAVGTGGLTDIRPLPGFTAVAATRFTYGPYDGSALSQVILYTPGQLTARAAKVTEPTPGTFDWGPLTTLVFPRQVELIVTVPSTSGARLAVLFTDTTAATYDFDGTALILRSNLPGNQYEFLAPVGTHALLSRTTNGDWQRWQVSSPNPTLTPVLQGSFPASSPATQVSNIVFVSGGEPFVHPEAVPVFLGHVRDWTTEATGSGSNWSVTSLVQGPDGLGSPAVTAYQPVPGGSHALVNQLRPDVSIRTLEPTAGPEVGDLFITPAAGTYPPLAPGESFFVTFSATRPVNVIIYRLAPGAAWQFYDPNAPPSLVADTTVEALALFFDGWSPTRSASYLFAPADPLTVGSSSDSDGDGLPDQWENAFAAYDPAGDEDGDGSPNGAEFQNGTDPRDAASFVIDNPLVLDFMVLGSLHDQTFRLMWPISDPSVMLQESPNLDRWNEVTEGINTTDTEFFYDVPLSGDIPSRRFFRLFRP